MHTCDPWICHVGYQTNGCFADLGLAHQGNAWLKNFKNFRTRMIPIFIHGDACPITGVGKSWSNSCQIWNWGGLLGVGTTVQIVFWILSVWKDLMSDNTRKRFWKIVTWSFRAMQVGLWPERNWNGDPWPRGSIDAFRANTPLVGNDCNTCFACQIWKVKGDLEDFHEDLEIVSQSYM
jgi:hypothetical protein